MDKWGIFATIGPELWAREVPNGETVPIWHLTPDWTSQFYPGVYNSIWRDGDPFANTWDICSFEKLPLNGDAEITVFSRRTAVREYYNFTWNTFVNAFQKPAPISRYKNAATTGTAMISPGGARGVTSVHIVSPEIDEDMLVDLRTLQFRLAESKQEKQQRILPWTRLLYWYGMLQQTDAATFGRVPWAIQNYLRGQNFGKAASSLTEEQLLAWQQQKMLPTADEFAWLWENERAEEIGKIELLQSLVNDPRRQANPIYMPNIPALLRHVSAQALDLTDMKALMTMGTVRERWRYKAREWQKLLQRRPALKAQCDTPGGLQLAGDDPEWQMICNHPLAQEEMEDDMEAYQHRKGDHGPGPMEKLRMSERQMDGMLAGMAAQSRQMEAWGSMMGIPAFSPLPVPDFSNPLLKRTPPPAWMVYRPYMI
jgi:hypothetical protein